MSFGLYDWLPRLPRMLIVTTGEFERSWQDARTTHARKMSASDVARRSPDCMALVFLSIRYDAFCEVEVLLGRIRREERVHPIAVGLRQADLRVEQQRQRCDTGFVLRVRHIEHGLRLIAFDLCSRDLLKRRLRRQICLANRERDPELR